MYLYNFPFIKNGNIRIGDKNYDLVPAETDGRTKIFDGPNRRGTRYILSDQAILQRYILGWKDAANVYVKPVKQMLTDIIPRFPQEQVNRNNFHPTHAMLSARDLTGVQNRGTTYARDTVKQVYWVDIAVLIDSAIWDR
ncbi:hypothetical protein CHS0354_010174, partial [Potamilus streckersoni]